MKKVTLILAGLAVTATLFAQRNQATRPVENNRTPAAEVRRDVAGVTPTGYRNRPGETFYTNDYFRRIREYIIREARLTTREANVFFPLYDAYLDKRADLEIEIRIAQERLLDDRRLTDRQVINLLDRIADLKIEIAKLEKNYINKYKKYLTGVKIRRILVAEDEFNDLYRREIRPVATPPAYNTVPVAPRDERPQTPPRTTQPQNNRRTR